jgi:hypothetical protein
VSRGDDVEVVGRAVVLVVLSTSQEFLVMHDPEICSLDGIVGVKGVRDPMFVIVALAGWDCWRQGRTLCLGFRATFA